MRFLALAMSAVLNVDVFHAQTTWRVVNPPVSGPIVDAVEDPARNVWISSRKYEGFIRIDPVGNATKIPTPGFTPRYLSFSGGYILATSGNWPRALGLMTTTGQFAIIVLAQNDPKVPAGRAFIGPLNDFYFGEPNGIGVFLGELRLISYPSGLTDNNNIGSMFDAYQNFWVTECCLNTGPSIVELNTDGQVIEYSLTASCATPAGVAVGRNGNVYVPCSSPGGGAAMVDVSPKTGQVSAVSLQLSYTTHVNTITTVGRSLYFAPGGTPAIWGYDTRTGKVRSIATPDGSIPNAIGIGMGLEVIAIAGNQLDIYRASPNR